MRELAVKRMTVDEFLDWDDGTETRYELVDGQPVAMASATPEHNEIALAISLALSSRTPPNCGSYRTKPFAEPTTIGAATCPTCSSRASRATKRRKRSRRRS